MIPALFSFLTIPILKNILGTSNFGIYSFYASVLLIINASFSGGITQSIIRLQIDYENKYLFFNQSILLTFFLSAIVSLPIFIYIQTEYNSFVFSLLFVLTLFFSNFYTSLLAITQSRLFSKVSAISESVRTGIFICFSLLLLQLCPHQNFLLLLFCSLATSYLTGCFFLLLKNKLSFQTIEWKSFVTTMGHIFKYGSYLVGWFVCSYGISMANRFVLAMKFGKENIGHFTASFDIINKSIVLLLSPVLLSLFPLVIKSFGEGNHKEVRALIRRLTIIEISLLFICLFVFSFFGFSLLSQILHTPATTEYLLIDIEIICSTFIWQIAMLQHKYLELDKKTSKMLLFIFTASLLSLTIDFFLIKKWGFKYSGIGFLTGGLFYTTIIMAYSNRYLKCPK